MDLEVVKEAISRADRYREQLVILVGESASLVLQDVSGANDLQVFNIGLELSPLLLEIPSIDRPKKASMLFTELIEQQNTNLLLLDHLEILFDRSLSIDPLKLLKTVAKNRTIVIAWPGQKLSSSLVYAQPNHQEYRSYKESEFNEIIIEADKL